jgi:hypothetical protein
MGKQNPELEKFADLLEKGTVALFMERNSELKFKTPVKNLKTIIEYGGKMRIDGMEKFGNEPTYVSAINYYANKVDMEKKKTLGAVIVYVSQEFMAKMMKIVQYPPVDDENETALEDSCGTLCNIIAGRFKSEISKEGYIELEMSHFVTARNNLVSGVNFCFSEFTKYEIVFDIDGAKRLVLEVTMGVVPRR